MRFFFSIFWVSYWLSCDWWSRTECLHALTPVDVRGLKIGGDGLVVHLLHARMEKISPRFSATLESHCTSPRSPTLFLLWLSDLVAAWAVCGTFQGFLEASCFSQTLLHPSPPASLSLVTDINAFGVFWDIFPIQRQLKGQLLKQYLFLTQPGAKLSLWHVETILMGLFCFIFTNPRDSCCLFIIQKEKLRLKLVRDLPLITHWLEVGLGRDPDLGTHRQWASAREWEMRTSLDCSLVLTFIASVTLGKHCSILKL